MKDVIVQNSEKRKSIGPDPRRLKHTRYLPRFKGPQPACAVAARLNVAARPKFFIGNPVYKRFNGRLEQSGVTLFILSDQDHGASQEVKTHGAQGIQ
jgi:hypothetical protein